MADYEVTTYAKGFSIEVEPPERAHEVLHYLICGVELGGNSLDGVKWRYVENSELLSKRAESLASDMRETIKYNKGK